MAQLDGLIGIKQVLQEGTPAPSRSAINFVGATVEDDPTNKRTTVRISPDGGAPAAHEATHLPGGSDALPLATTQAAGLMSAAQASALVAAGVLEELEPIDLNFHEIAAPARSEFMPPALVYLDDEFTNATTTRFTTYTVSRLGNIASGGGQFTITSTAGPTRTPASSKGLTSACRRPRWR